ncbi:Stromal cell-derived factor 2-like protein 1 [Mortierella sp. GBA35]|nr:Stromal cell-derived factor 2-like protein 1 [Mortierella sp. GBA35]
MRYTISSLACLALVASTALAGSTPEIDDEYQKVTCGSSIKLTHEKSGFKLHSHQIPYGTGSGQQSITAVPGKDDTNSLWIVMAQLGHSCERGEPVPCDSTIRLKHVNTKKFLHSHHHHAPMSGGLEVSCYEGQDDGDNWVVECTNNKNDENGYWTRESQVRMRHEATGMYLSSSSRHVYGNPIPGHQEVAAHRAEYQPAESNCLFCREF